jgi:hypothetical protein
MPVSRGRLLAELENGTSGAKQGAVVEVDGTR